MSEQRYTEHKFERKEQASLRNGQEKQQLIEELDKLNANFEGKKDGDK